MRIPQYPAQYYQTRANLPAPTAVVLPVVLVAAIVLLYLGTLAVLLSGTWS